MTRINTNVPSMLAQRILTSQNTQLTTSLERLSTGLRINRGADDPAGLIASENLRAEKAAITAAIGNAERAEQVVNIAEGGLQEVSALLIELESLVDQSANDAGLTTEEKQANQLQIDSILQTVDRIANSTSFNGVKLLNGTYSYTTDATAANLAKMDDVQVNAARIPDGGKIGVTLDVVTSAQVGTVFLSLDGAANDNVSGTTLTLEVTGAKGVQSFSFASGSDNADIVAGINAFKDVTGVSASTSGADVVFSATEVGSENFVSVKKTGGDAAYDTLRTTDADLEATGSASGEVKDTGRDAVVNINGTSATTDGLTARVSNSSLDIEITIAAAANTAGSISMDITGGGATFQLAPTLELAGKASLGIQSVTTGGLGNTSVGHLSDLAAGGTANVTNGNVDSAQAIIREAQSQVSSLRGRLGAFQKNTVNASIRSLGVALENTSAAESQIRDTDFATETATMTRQQILVNAATNVLSIANNQPQSVLALLGG